MRILVRADGSFIRGMGHVSKQITFCTRLRKRGHEILFVIQSNEETRRMLSENDFRFKEIRGSALADIAEFALDFRPDLIILDILNTTTEYISSLKRFGAKIVTFDNVDLSAFECDLIFNIMYYHSAETRNTINRAGLYEGYSYIVVDEIYKEIPGLNKHEVRRVLLTQGGADTTNKTCFLMEALMSVRNVASIPFDLDVVIGPVFDKNNVRNIEQIASTVDAVAIYHKPKGLAGLIAACDMAITAGGTTMWEIASCRRPFYIHINEAFEDETARLISSLGFGLYDGWSPARESIENSLIRLITDSTLREKMIQNMEAYDLLKGADRIIEKMYEHQVLV